MLVLPLERVRCSYTYDMRLLLGFELLMKLTQTGSSVVVRVGRRRRPRQKLGAQRMSRLLAGHLARSGNRGVVDLEVHED